MFLIVFFKHKEPQVIPLKGLKMGINFKLQQMIDDKVSSVYIATNETDKAAAIDMWGQK